MAHHGNPPGSGTTSGSGPHSGLQPRARLQGPPVSALVQGQPLVMAVGHKTRALLASASPAQREAWRKAIEFEEDLGVAGEAADGLRLLSLLQAFPIEILLLQGRLGTIELLHEVHAKSPKTKTLIVGDSLSDEYISRVLSLGVRGLLNGCEPTDYAKAIRGVARGDVWVARSKLLQLLAGVPQAPVQLLPAPPRPIGPLTFREQEITAGVAQGLSNKEIGRRLGISDKTIKVHLNHVFRKLRIQRRIQLLLSRDHPGSTPVAATPLLKLPERLRVRSESR